MDPLPPDPYKALGVSKDAPNPEIRNAYRKLVLKCHPDKVHDEAQKEEKKVEFHNIQKAYELLNNEKERNRYDEMVKVMELRDKKRNANVEANMSVPRTPPRYYDVRTPEHHPDTFKTKSTSRGQTASAKMYSQYPPPRSWEDDVYNTSRHYEDTSRSSRRTASYDERPSQRDEERRRRKKEEARKEDLEERDRLAARARAAAAAEKAEKAEKEKRRLEKDHAKKIREKQRRREAEEKQARDKTVYLEPSEDDEPPRAKPEKKASSSRKHEEKEKREREHSSSRQEVYQDKTEAFMLGAVRYMTAARSKPGAATHPSLNRAHTYGDPYSNRRSSDTPKTRDRSAHKKSSSGPKEAPGASPIIIDSGRTPPHFSKSGTTPPSAPESPPRSGKLPRSQTLKESEFGRVPPQPSISRASTYHYGGEPDPRGDPRGRNRSRMHAQLAPEAASEGSESEEDVQYYEDQRRRHRHRTLSPEPMATADYGPPPQQRSTKSHYKVNNGRAVPMSIPLDPSYSYRESSPPSHKSKSGAAYYSSHARMSDVRPQMPTRESAYSSSSNGAYFNKVKTAKNYTNEDVQYSSHMPQQYSYHREEALGRA